MALTAAIIKANAALAGLTDEQISVIETLSTNDEASVIGQRIGALHGQYDTDVMTVAGVAKNQGEKSYDYVKRVLGELKAKADSVSTIEGQITTLKQEKADLEKQLREKSTDPAVKQKLIDTEKALVDLQTLYRKEKDEWQTKDEGYKKDLRDFKVGSIFDLSLSKMSFLPTLPESVKNTFINKVKSDLLNEFTPEFVQEDGAEVVRFRDKDNNLVTNPANGLKPFSVDEILADRLKDVLESDYKPGAGTGPSRKPAVTTKLDITTAKTQVAADELIEAHLLKSGLSRTNPEFAEKHQALRTELNVSKLPIQ